MKKQKIEVFKPVPPFLVCNEFWFVYVDFTIPKDFYTLLKPLSEKPKTTRKKSASSFIISPMGFQKQK